MSKLSKTTLPKNSIINNFIKRNDYEDCYSFTVQNNHKSIRELYISIFSSAPKWVEDMTKLRNKIVRLFGLKTEMNSNENTNFQVGEKIGIFKIYAIQEDEIIAGEDDKHLEFRVSIHRIVEEETTLSISTLVQYNNWFGKLYFFVVKPFHEIVVKSLIKKASKNYSIQPVFISIN